MLLWKNLRLLLRKGRLDICTQLAVSSTVLEMIIAVLGVCKEVQQDLMLTVIMCSLNCTEKLNIHRFAFIIQMFFEMKMIKSSVY